MDSRRRRLGDVLIERGVLTEEQLHKALERQKAVKAPLGAVLTELGYVTPEKIADVLAEQLRVARAVWDESSLDPELALLVPDELLRGDQLFPVRRQGNVLTLGMVDPLDIFAMDAVRDATGLYVEPAVATQREIKQARERVANLALVADSVVAEIEDEPEEYEEPEDNIDVLPDSPGVRVVNVLLAKAIRDRASDIHIEPRETRLMVRFRVDGVLREEMRLPKKLQSDVITRIKVMSNLDITERRKPQDGRMKVTIAEQDVDMRVSVLPTIYGEKIVIRILDKNASLFALDQIGFLPESVRTMEKLLRHPQGLILVTGPTGSGKTTTQYGFLNRLNTPDKNIVTVEDPVEYRLEGVNQVQVNPRIGVDFAANLRSVLRQDPDIVMVGEIRDKETADIAVRAALTGHLVLSTIHTNSACGTLTRLVDMGIAPFLISDTLLGVISQRLVRTICPYCKEEVPVTEVAEKQFLASHGMAADKLWRGKGCPQCRHSGFRGRVPVEEVLTVSRELRRILEHNPTEEALFAAARADGFRTIVENGLTKVLAGVTTISELWRTVYSVEEM